jgi:hypothetical protein
VAKYVRYCIIVEVNVEEPLEDFPEDLTTAEAIEAYMREERWDYLGDAARYPEDWYFDVRIVEHE